MDMARSSNIQIKSMDTFSCQQFKQLFSGGNRNGVITTTTNGRKYNVVWEMSTNTISVERDLTNVDRWTRFSETIGRWADGDFTSNAEKWESRLTTQQQNMSLAKPLGEKITGLLIQIEGVNTGVEFGQVLGKSMQDQLNQISTPLTQLLQEKKQHLYKQAQQLSLAVNQKLPSNHAWTQQQKMENAINKLEEQLQKLIFFSMSIENIIGSYSSAMGTIGVSKNPLICATILIRLNSVAIKIQQTVDDYFKPDGKPKTETINGYNAVSQNEVEIALALSGQQFPTHFSHNNLLLPSFEESGTKDTQQQARIEFNYQTQRIIFINTLVDPTKTWQDIKDVADALKLMSYQLGSKIIL